MTENEKLVERASAAITLGDRTGSRGNSPSNIYNVAADLLTALTAAQARIRELDTALAPFANDWRAFPGYDPDGEPTKATDADFKNARRALKEASDD